MNQEELWKTRYRNLNKYFPNRPINSIILGSGKLEHELSKFMAGFIVAKGGDLRVLFHQVVPYIIDFCNKTRFIENWFFEPRKFITEVSDVDNPNGEQYDMVIIDSNEKIEFDKTHKSKNKKDVTIFEVKK